MLPFTDKVILNVPEYQVPAVVFYGTSWNGVFRCKRRVMFALGKQDGTRESGANGRKSVAFDP